MTAPVVDVPMQRCLDAMAWLEHHGVPGPWVRGQIAPLARPAGGGIGYAPGRIEFFDALVRLRMASMIAYQTPDPITLAIALTDKGRKAARLSVERPAGQSATEELHGAIRAVIDGPMNRCLSALIERYPKAMEASVSVPARGCFSMATADD